MRIHWMEIARWAQRIKGSPRSDGRAERGARWGWLGWGRLLFVGCAFMGRGGDVTEAPSWPPAVVQALDRAGTNRAQLELALHRAAGGLREGMQFLIEHMPQRDLQHLSADYLLENVTLAYEAFAAAPWRDRVPQELFLNEVLPYASVNEPREAWRRVLREKSVPIVQGCRSPGEAACRLNEKLFALLNVRYSTQRRRPDQGPLETLASGVASCTGLTILLVDACRSVGVPARVAGTPNWADGRGNHTWAEVWDGEWHFLGAAEPDPKGLNHGWFAGDAARAIKDSREHAIYASSFRGTGLTFPMVWARRVSEVPAVNVTDRYTARVTPANPNRVRLMVKVLEAAEGRRVAAAVQLLARGTNQVVAEGQSRDERADLNDLLSFEVERGRPYELRAEAEGRVGYGRFAGTTNAQAMLTVCLGAPLPKGPGEGPHHTLIPGEPSQLASREETRLRQAFLEFFGRTAGERARWAFPRGLERYLQVDEAAVRRAAWDAYRNAPIHDALRADATNRVARHGEQVSPFTVKEVGQRPARGWPLVIAMHGGGNAPKEVNDRQWRVMQGYYRDQPELGGYRYVALRAPNDTWNGFYADYVYPLVAQLIRQFLVLGDVDPDRVFLIGYSHGGYGAFAIGPKMPDRFAAIHASAAAPTDGETSARTLRNTVFTYMIGELDTMYGRLPRCQAFDQTIRSLRGDRTDLYPVTMEFQAGYPHSGLPDRDKLRWLYPAVRQPAPRELSWELTDPVIGSFYWLRVARPGKGQAIEARCQDNRVVLTTKSVGAAAVLLDRRLVDFTRPVVLEVNGRCAERRLQPSLRVLAETLEERGDPALAFTARWAF